MIYFLLFMVSILLLKIYNVLSRFRKMKIAMTHMAWLTLAKKGWSEGVAVDFAKMEMTSWVYMSMDELYINNQFIYSLRRLSEPDGIRWEARACRYVLSGAQRVLTPIQYWQERALKSTLDSDPEKIARNK